MMCSQLGDISLAAECIEEELVKKMLEPQVTKVDKQDVTFVQTEENMDVGKIAINNLHCACENNSELSVVVDNFDSNSVMGDSGILSASDGTPDLNVNYHNGSTDEIESKGSNHVSNASAVINGNGLHHPVNTTQQFVPTMEPADSAQYNITVLDNGTAVNTNIPYVAGSGMHYALASPSTQSRGNSPRGQNSPPTSQGQHAVLVHVNPGETFSVRVGDQIQHIQGPATVRMVSNNGPPLPMPMQVPPGHMVQQIVDENGILTHVILSPQPPGVHSPPLTVAYYGGSNGMAHSMYPACGMLYGPYQPPPSSQYGPPQHPHVHPHVHQSSSVHHTCNNHNHSVNHSGMKFCFGFVNKV